MKIGPCWKFHVFFVVFLIGLLLAGCGETQSEVPFDPDIGGFRQVRLVSGEEAVNSINKLHGMPIQMTRGIVGYYEGIRDKATVWVSQAATEDVGRKQVEVMIGKMRGSGRSPFSGYSTSVEDGRKVSRFVGLGQAHAVFTEEAWVYWVSAHPEDMDLLLKHLWKGK